MDFNTSIKIDIQAISLEELVYDYFKKNGTIITGYDLEYLKAVTFSVLIQEEQGFLNLLHKHVDSFIRRIVEKKSIIELIAVHKSSIWPARSSNVIVKLNENPVPIVVIPNPFKVTDKLAPLSRSSKEVTKMSRTVIESKDKDEVLFVESPIEEIFINQADSTLNDKNESTIVEIFDDCYSVADCGVNSRRSSLDKLQIRKRAISKHMGEATKENILDGILNLLENRISKDFILEQIEEHQPMLASKFLLNKKVLDEIQNLTVTVVKNYTQSKSNVPNSPSLMAETKVKEMNRVFKILLSAFVAYFVCIIYIFCY